MIILITLGNKMGDEATHYTFRVGDIKENIYAHDRARAMITANRSLAQYITTPGAWMDSVSENEFYWANGNFWD